ncbi:MAG: prepilin-type N-terminal cleavage/methylation domain-containing protein [bacterium]
MKTRSRAAFTLIEMLLVIAIIGVLGAMLYPVLSKVRESGRVVKCASNLRQLQLAVVNYGTVPQATNYWSGDPGRYVLVTGWVGWKSPLPTAPTAGAYDWRGDAGQSCISNGVLWGYVKSLDIYVCPSHKVAAKTYDISRSYSMFVNASGQGFVGMSGSPNTILFGDDRNAGSSPYNVGFVTNNVATWHTGKGNVVFLDGHIERR